MTIRTVKLNNWEEIDCPVCGEKLPIGETDDNPAVGHLEERAGLIGSLFNSRFVCLAHENCVENFRVNYQPLDAETFLCASGCQTRLANQPPRDELPSAAEKIVDSLDHPALGIAMIGSALLGLSLQKGPLFTFAVQILLFGAAFKDNELEMGIGAAATLNASGDEVCQIALPIIAGFLPAIAHFIKPADERRGLAASMAATAAVAGANALITQGGMMQALGSSLLSLSATAITASVLRKCNA